MERMLPDRRREMNSPHRLAVVPAGGAGCLGQAALSGIAGLRQGPADLAGARPLTRQMGGGAAAPLPARRRGVKYGRGLGARHVML